MCADCVSRSKPNTDSGATPCARFGEARLDVFGSALRHDFRPRRSDPGLLVEFGGTKQILYAAQRAADR